MDQLLKYCRSTDSNMAMIRTTPAGQHAALTLISMENVLALVHG